MTAARTLVISFVDALHTAGKAMQAAIPSLEQLADTLALVRSHQVSRSGEIGAYFYKVHGAGCLFISQDGSEIDVDFAADGTEIFDFWRLRRYGQSLREPFDPTEEEMRSAVESLKPLLAEVRPGWFSMAKTNPSA
ncbi:DUF6896 domain-containing protein [Streptomyces gibsoniae]|uniref:DUF6896 domain-containing protein n=1 Tax=Streptomyces gibsoniae TaxID=3075529 RepID=A0ABU2U249_9ACTN|nr:hypothetical protein [Streptomyces sp. DSM 41699]MDT0467298.1 hypothetical protein [Streptomyces sp. DSM 41699]